MQHQSPGREPGLQSWVAALADDDHPHARSDRDQAGAGEHGAVATGVALLGGSLFTLWALGHRSVQAWVFDRWLVRHRL